MPYSIRQTPPGITVTQPRTVNNTEFAALDRGLLALVVQTRETGETQALTAEIVFVMPGDPDYVKARGWNGFFSTRDKSAHIYRDLPEAKAFISQL